MKAERAEEIAEEKFECNRGLVMRFKEGSCLLNMKVQGEAASADGEAAGNYPGNLANTDFNVVKTALFGRSCYLRLVQMERRKCLAGELQRIG